MNASVKLKEIIALFEERKERPRLLQVDAAIIRQYIRKLHPQSEEGGYEYKERWSSSVLVGWDITEGLIIDITGRLEFRTTSGRLHRCYVQSGQDFIDLVKRINEYKKTFEQLKAKNMRKIKLAGMSYSAILSSTLDSLNLEDRANWKIYNHENLVFFLYNDSVIFKTVIRKKNPQKDLELIKDNLQNIIMYIKNIHLTSRGKLV
jgi:hypothetical protein